MQLAKINPDQFGNLITIPNVLEQNQSLAQRAVATCSQTVQELKKLDLSALPLEQGEKNDAELNALQVKLKDAYTLMQDRRKPFTQFFDDIKGMFTACEGQVLTVGKEVKEVRDAWQKEKARRIAEEQQRQQIAMAKEQEEIDMRTYCKTALTSAFYKALAQVIDKMNNAFNAQTDLDAYEPKLRKYTPVLDEATFTGLIPSLNAKPQHFTQEQAQAIYTEVANAEKAGLSQVWVTALTAERDRLIELIPSRKKEIERGNEAEAQARMAREKAEREAQLAQEAADREQAAKLTAEADSMNAAFETAQAAPVVGMSKGTVVKKVYKATTHKAWVALLQAWVANDMNRMTLDELQKKLGFIRTACEVRLNEGTVLEAEGLSVEEDYSTRTSRKKAVA